METLVGRSCWIALSRSGGVHQLVVGQLCRLASRLSGFPNARQLHHASSSPTDDKQTKRTVESRRLSSSAAAAATAAATSSSLKLDIGGIFPPIVTSFDCHENIDYEKIQFNMTRWNDVPFRGYVVQGSNGECAYLRPEERVELVKQVRKMAPTDKLIIAGSGCESTRDTIEMTKRMADVGAGAVLVVTPCYYKSSMNQETLCQHFHQVADASPVPVILYSVPGNTGIDLAPEIVIKLSTHPNIVGLKDSGGDITKIGNMVYKTKENNFQIIAGSAGFLLPALTVGCVGGICALANVLGPDVCRLFQLHKDGSTEEARQLQHRLIAPNTAVTKRFGVPGLKQAMDWFGYYGGRTRHPLLPLTASEVAQLKQTFKGSGYSPS